MNIGSRELFAENVQNLPYDSEVEWIEGLGDQAIVITEFTQQYVDFVLDFCFTSTPLITSVILGSWNPYQRVQLAVIDGNFMLGEGTSDSAVGITHGERIEKDKIYHIKFSSKNSIGSIFGIFCRVISGSSPDLITPNLRMFSFSVLSRNSQNVLMNLKPIRIGSVGYMYDSISDQLFSNAGSGAFVIGPDKK